MSRLSFSSIDVTAKGRKVYIINSGRVYDALGQLIFAVQVTPDIFLMEDISRGVGYCLEGALDSLEDDKAAIGEAIMAAYDKPGNNDMNVEWELKQDIMDDLSLFMRDMITRNINC